MGEEIRHAALMRGNAICLQMDITFSAFLSLFRTLCAGPVNMHVILPRCGVAHSRAVSRGFGLRGGWRDGPFQCQFTAIPAVKKEREKKVRALPIFFLRSFSLIQLDLSMSYL